MKQAKVALLLCYACSICINLAQCLTNGANFIPSILITVIGSAIAETIILMIVSIIWSKNPLFIFKELFKPCKEDENE